MHMRAKAFGNLIRDAFRRFRRCDRAATITEYGLIAALIVTASGAVDSRRFQSIKEDDCVARHTGCPTVPPAVAAAMLKQTADAKRAPGKAVKVQAGARRARNAAAAGPDLRRTKQS